MTLLALAFSGFKTLNTLFTRHLNSSSVSHLNEAALRDIGLYREAGRVFPMHPEHFELTVAPAPITAKGKESANSVIMIPHYLSDSSG